MEFVIQAENSGSLAANLQTILKTDVFSKAFKEDQKKEIIINLLYVGFQAEYKIVRDID